MEEREIQQSYLEHLISIFEAYDIETYRCNSDIGYSMIKERIKKSNDSIIHKLKDILYINSLSETSRFFVKNYTDNKIFDQEPLLTNLSDALGGAINISVWITEVLKLDSFINYDHFKRKHKIALILKELESDE